MVAIVKAAACALCVLVVFTASANAVPGDTRQSDSELFNSDETSLEQLLSEAEELQTAGRPIDARAKFQQAMKLAPKDYRPHMMLGQYYLFEVAHFKLAYQYIKAAVDLFEKEFGDENSDQLDELNSRQHAFLLYLLSEAQLNLDKYQDSLATLDRFENNYWMDWYPGTRAWVLMKLKRVDEAISVAQSGLLTGADPRRTWNIMGILLSIRGQRRLSLQAFAQAIRSEYLLGGRGRIATPLNNAGEVYRELFEDNFAEAAWVTALQLPDGCEHILPSLNLAILYIDQLRLFQADRVLKDFKACFALQSERKDSEHRTLLALARGKVLLYQNQVDPALEEFFVATQDQQWFGKIGTQEDDVKFAANVALANAYEAKAEALRDHVFESLFDAAQARGEIVYYQLRSWWLNRKARELGLRKLDDLEDLLIRNTDTMVQYPTLGTALAAFNELSFAKRIERMIKNDSRKDAHTYYQLYLATNLLYHGEEEEALEILRDVRKRLRPIDRLALAETLVRIIQAESRIYGFFNRPSSEEELSILRNKEELFGTLPSHLRFNGIALPVDLRISLAENSDQELLEEIADELLSVRFERIPPQLKEKARYALVISSSIAPEADTHLISIHLLDTLQDTQKIMLSEKLEDNGKGKEALVNNFIAKVFSHQVDPPGGELPKLPILEGIVK